MGSVRYVVDRRSDLPVAIADESSSGSQDLGGLAYLASERCNDGSMGVTVEVANDGRIIDPKEASHAAQTQSAP